MTPNTTASRDQLRQLLRDFANTPGVADPAVHLLQFILSIPLWRETAELVFIAFGVWTDLATSEPVPPELRLAVARAVATSRRWDRIRELLVPLVALPVAPSSMALAESKFPSDAEPNPQIPTVRDARAIARMADIQIGHLMAACQLADLSAPGFPPQTTPANPHFIPADPDSRCALSLAFLVAGHFAAVDTLAAIDSDSDTPAPSPARHAAWMTRAHVAWRDGRFADASTLADNALAATTQDSPFEAASAALFGAVARLATGNLAAPALGDHHNRLRFAGPPDLGSDLAWGLPVEPLAGPSRPGCRPLADALAAAITERAIAVDPAGIVFAALGSARLHLADHAQPAAIAALEAGLDALVAIPGHAGGTWYNVLKQTRAHVGTLADASTPTTAAATSTRVVSAPGPIPPAIRAHPDPAWRSGLGPDNHSPLPDIHALQLTTPSLSRLLERFDPTFTAPEIAAPPTAVTDLAANATTPSPGQTGAHNANPPDHTARDTFVAADYLWDYRCNGKGCCCGGWNAGLTEADLHRLAVLTAGTTLEPVLDRELFPHEHGPFAAFLPNRANRPAAHNTQVRRLGFSNDKRCAFLEDDELCSIHNTFGENGLADVCQVFPIVTRISDLGISGSWDPICPEVARQLAASATPARLVPRPATFTRAIRAEGDRAPEARRVAARHTPVERYQFQQFRHQLAAAFAAVPDRPLAVIAAAVDVLKHWEQQQTRPPLDLADLALSGPAHLPHVVDALAAHIAAPFDPLADITDHVTLARQFFIHHPWGTALTLDTLADAVDPHWGRLGWPSLALHWLEHHGHDDPLVLTNHLIALVSGPEPGHGSLLLEIGGLIVKIGDALAVRGVMGDSDDPEVTRGIFASAIVFAELTNRSNTKHLDTFAEAFATGLDRTTRAIPVNGSLADIVGPLTVALRGPT